MKDVGWIPTGELSSGDPVKLKSDEYVPIESYDVIILDELIKVYNFEVEDNHNYYVSENEVLVHNGYEERRTSRQAFRAAKREVGIPTSAQFDNHKFVFDGSTENRTVYTFKIGKKKKQIVKHTNDKRGRGKHYHVVKGGNPLKKGKYRQSRKHHPDDFKGFK